MPGKEHLSAQVCAEWIVENFPIHDFNLKLSRLDFDTFVIAQPDVSTDTNVGDVANGDVVPVGSGTPFSTASRCITDQFSVTSPGKSSPPVICGTNTNQHSTGS